MIKEKSDSGTINDNAGDENQKSNSSDDETVHFIGSIKNSNEENENSRSFFRINVQISFKRFAFVLQNFIDSIFLFLLFINLKNPEKSFLPLKEKKFYQYITENQKRDWSEIELIRLVVEGKLKELKSRLILYNISKEYICSIRDTAGN